MCRLTAVICSGEPLLLADVITKPRMSIIAQSFDSRERMIYTNPRSAYQKGSLNGDGFGVGWYAENGQPVVAPNAPCVFTSLRPAWNDANLYAIAEKTISPLIFAHVRAAGPGTGPPNESNCHPFKKGNILFMHNGTIASFRLLRRSFMTFLSEEAFDFATDKGCIDSVIIFALFISFLPNGSQGEYSPNDLRIVLEKTINVIGEGLDTVKTLEGTLLNIVISNGKCLVASRYGKEANCNNSKKDSYLCVSEEPCDSVFIQQEEGAADAATLYFASGTRWEAIPNKPDSFRMVHNDKRAETAIITSEPLTEDLEEWVPVPKNHIIVITHNIDILLFKISADSSKDLINTNKMLGSLTNVHGYTPKVISTESLSPLSITDISLLNKSQKCEKKKILEKQPPDVRLTTVSSSSVLCLVTVDFKQIIQATVAELVAPSGRRIRVPFELLPSKLSHQLFHDMIHPPGIVTSNDLEFHAQTIKPACGLSVDTGNWMVVGDKSGCIQIIPATPNAPIVQFTEAHKGGVLSLAILFNPFKLNKKKMKNNELFQNNSSRKQPATHTRIYKFLEKCTKICLFLPTVFLLSGSSDTTLKVWDITLNLMGYLLDNKKFSRTARTIIFQRQEGRFIKYKHINQKVTKVLFSISPRRFVKRAKKVRCKVYMPFYDQLVRTSEMQCFNGKSFSTLTARLLDSHISDSLVLGIQLMPSQGDILSLTVKKASVIYIGFQSTAVACIDVRQLIRYINILEIISVLRMITNFEKLERSYDKLGIVYPNDKNITPKAIVIGDQRSNNFNLSYKDVFDKINSRSPTVLSAELILNINQSWSSSNDNLTKSDLTPAHVSPDEFKKQRFARLPCILPLAWSLYVDTIDDIDYRGSTTFSIDGEEEKSLLNCIDFLRLSNTVKLHHTVLYKEKKTQDQKFISPFVLNLLEKYKTCHLFQSESIRLKYKEILLLNKLRINWQRDHHSRKIKQHQQSFNQYFNLLFNDQFCNIKLDCFFMPAPYTERHYGFVEALVFSYPFIVSGGGDGLIKLWRGTTIIQTFYGHSGGILCLAADDSALLPTSLIVSGSRDKTVRLWAFESRSCRRILTGHRSDVLAVALAFDYIASGSATGEVFLWCRKQYCLLQRFQTQDNSAVTAISIGSYSLNIVELIAATGSGEIILWRTSYQKSSLRGKLKKRFAVSSQCKRMPTLNCRLEQLLADLVAYKTVSCDLSCTEHLWSAARYLVDCFCLLGATVRCADSGVGQGPVVIARLGNDENKPTVLFYGHYDVVPAAKGTKAKTAGSRSVWNTNPWVLQNIDGFLYGRGTTDNKGPIVASIFAVHSFLHPTESFEQFFCVGGRLATQGKSTAVGISKRLPVNIVWIIEGDEEEGSRGFQNVVRQEMHTMADVNCVLCSNSYWVDDAQPCIVSGMRGVLDAQLSVSGGTAALGNHSGYHGGVIREPMQDLLHLLGSLTDEQGHVLVDGFYTNVKTPPESFKSANEVALALPGGNSRDSNKSEGEEFSCPLESYKNLVEGACIKANSFEEVNQKRWLEPVLSVTEITIPIQNFFTLGSNFRLIPSKAVANISIRLVPEQTGTSIMKKLEKHISHTAKNILKTENEIKLREITQGDYWEEDVNSFVYEAANKSVRKTYGTNALHAREGGTMPVMAFLQYTFKAPTIQLPIGRSSDQAHLPNERVSLLGLYKGVELFANFFIEIASTWKKPQKN